MSDWQPIETFVPDDHFIEDVIITDGREVALAWHDDDSWHLSARDFDDEIKWTPTHWMPMPSPTGLPQPPQCADDVMFVRDPEHPARLPIAYNFEQQGTGYDRDAVGYERLGRRQKP
jgi:hypothetical protein